MGENASWQPACLHANISEQFEKLKESTHVRYSKECAKPLEQRKWTLYRDCEVVFGSINANKKDEEAAVAGLAPLKGADRLALIGILEKLAHKVSCNKRGGCTLSCCQLLALRVWRCDARLLVLGRRREQAASGECEDFAAPKAAHSRRLALLARADQTFRTVNADGSRSLRAKAQQTSCAQTQRSPRRATADHRRYDAPGHVDARLTIDGRRRDPRRARRAFSQRRHTRRLRVKRCAPHRLRTPPRHLADFRRLTLERAFTVLLVAGEPQSERASRANNERTLKIEKLVTQLATLAMQNRKTASSEYQSTVANVNCFFRRHRHFFPRRQQRIPTSS